MARLTFGALVVVAAVGVESVRPRRRWVTHRAPCLVLDSCFGRDAVGLLHHNRIAGNLQNLHYIMFIICIINVTSTLKTCFRRGQLFNKFNKLVWLKAKKHIFFKLLLSSK